MIDYEQKYKEALERARELYEYDPHILSDIFPELKDSDDERMRKEIKKDAEAWYKEHYEGTNPQGRSIVIGAYIDGALAWLEKQAKQKPADETESKFNVGDWIINNDKRIAVPIQILKIEKYGYVTSDGYTSFDKVKTDYHFWTIQDAKDGDVLVFDDIIMIFKNIKTICTANTYILYCDGIVVEDWCDFGNDAHPATKEQRDILFQKMKEAGYEWDANKKELKKIGQKPTWSEEDERMFDSIIEDVMPYGECPDYPKDEEREYFYEGDRKVEWLKSLKERINHTNNI